MCVIGTIQDLFYDTSNHYTNHKVSFTSESISFSFFLFFFISKKFFLQPALLHMQDLPKQ